MSSPLLAGLLAVLLTTPAPEKPANRLPDLMLWAWERPENLEFLSPADAGVAFLARTIEIRGSSLGYQSRRAPLRIPAGVATLAVVRLESRSVVGAAPEQVAAMIRDLWELPGVAGVQVDFDARNSERRFYREFLRCLRGEMPPGKQLSITALGSWCVGDAWIRDLPIDEAVPMLFAMGPDGTTIRRLLREGGDFRPSVARHSVGISLDEPLPGLPRGRRVYVFDPRPWTRADFRLARERVGR